MNSANKIIIFVLVILIIVGIYYHYSSQNASFKKPKIKSSSERFNENLQSVNKTNFVIVTTTNGKVKGEKVIVDHVSVNAFLGIQYATAKRFEEPKKIVWKNIRNAFDMPPSCPQNELLSDLSAFKFLTPNFTEDCLYLNIFAPTNNNPMIKRPILVYIHGGLFSFGGIGTDELDGRYFAAKYNIVFIAIQYRIGALGFINIDDRINNFGLRDQQYALEWIRENSADFGGNEGQITVVGHGVETIGIMELSNKKLFHKSILHGGFLLSQYKNFISKFNETSSSFLKSLRCSDELLNCLKKMSVRSILEVQNKIASDNLLFGPTIKLDEEPHNLSDSLHDENDNENQVPSAFRNFNGNMIINLDSEDDFIFDKNENCNDFISFLDNLSLNKNISFKLYKIEEFSSFHDEVVFALGIPMLQSSNFEADEKQLSRFLGSIWSEFITHK